MPVAHSVTGIFLFSRLLHLKLLLQLVDISCRRRNKSGRHDIRHIANSDNLDQF